MLRIELTCAHCIYEPSAGTLYGNRYNSAADIWSFGITILELAHGHAPFARFPPMKVLLMTIQNPPPRLDSAQNEFGKKHFSKVCISATLQSDARAISCCLPCWSICRSATHWPLHGKLQLQLGIPPAI